MTSPPTAKGRRALTVHAYPAEVTALEVAAKRAGLDLSAYIVQAALTAARDQHVPAYSPHQLAHLQRQRIETGEAWTLAELEERQLPLYWDTAWLRDQLQNGETYTSLAARHGYNARTMSAHGRRLGLSFRRTVRLDLAGPWPADVTQVAERQFGGSSAAAAQWLSEQVANGLLKRLQRGVYDLTSESTEQQDTQVPV